MRSDNSTFSEWNCSLLCSEMLGALDRLDVCVQYMNVKKGHGEEGHGLFFLHK